MSIDGRAGPAARGARVGDNRGMVRDFLAMPPAIRLFLGYAFLILGAIGLALRTVIDQAIAAPVSFIGVVVMALLAYTIFTVTLVLQRKEAGRALAIGLSTLTIPAVPLLFLSGVLPAALLVLAVAVALLRGLTGEAARAWLSEP